MAAHDDKISTNRRRLFKALSRCAGGDDAAAGVGLGQLQRVSVCPKGP